MAIDSYVLDIQEKDSSSALLAELALKTLSGEYVHQVVPGKNGLSFLKIPADYVLVGHSSGGDYSIRDSQEYAASVFNNLMMNARRIGAKPIAMADVIDARSTDEKFVRGIGTTLSDLALQNDVAIINGELAKLGDMMNCDCNITGTMLGIIRRDNVKENLPFMFDNQGTRYFMFDPQGKYIWMNSDGTGTKPLTNTRFGREIDSVDDLFAMQFDDKGRFGGGAIASFNALETNNENVPSRAILERAKLRAKEIGAYAVMQHENVGNRILGPNGEENVYNMSGTLVSSFSEEDIERIPRLQEGNDLIAIKAKGGRSNGYTDRRRLVAEWFGNDWHWTQGGKFFGEFLIKPSIIFYPVFAELIGKGLADGTFHMSGGAYRDKLSRLISREGLYAEIGIQDGSPQLFKPDVREAAIASQFNIFNAYTKFALGNEGFVATNKSDEVIDILRRRGLESRVVGKLEKRSDVKGLKLRAFNGDVVDFSVKN